MHRLKQKHEEATLTGIITLRVFGAPPVTAFVREQRYVVKCAWRGGGGKIFV
jgi:hypothetical protein